MKSKPFRQIIEITNYVPYISNCCGRRRVLFLFLMLFSLNLFAQTDFRADTTLRYPVKVNSGYTYPRIINITNWHDTICYVKFYDQVSTPTHTSVPVYTIYCPQGTTTQIQARLMGFYNAMWVRVARNPYDADTTINSKVIPIIEIIY